MKTKSIFKSYVSILLTLCILFSMTAVGFTTVSAATSSEPIGGIIKDVTLDKMLDIGFRVACEGMVAISEASAEKGNNGISKTTALIAEWGLMSAEEAATTKNIELCEQILSELQSLAKTTETGISNINTAIAQLQADFSTNELSTRQDMDINQVISGINITGGVLEYYDNYIEVASKYNDGLASRDDMILAQRDFLFGLRNYIGITTEYEEKTTEEQLEIFSEQLFGDPEKADVVNQDIEKIIGTLSKNLIIEPGVHPENVMSEAMELAANYFPFSHQQYDFVIQQVGIQIQTLVKILMMYNEILALQYGYLTQTQSSLITTYDSHAKAFHNTLIPGVLDNINTMLKAKYDLISIGISMSIDDYMKPEDAVVTNLKTEKFVQDYAQNSNWGEYHTYHKLMTTTYGTKHSVYYLLNDTRGMADLYDYKYGNPEHGPSYSNITADINDGCNTFSLPEVTGDNVNYDDFFGTNAFPLRNSVIRNYLFDFDSNGVSYPLLSNNSPLYILTKSYTEKHGHVDKSYIVDVDASQTASNLIKTIGFTPSGDPANRDYSTYFTTIFAPTDTYKQRVTAEVSGASGVDMQIVATDSENREITIANGNSGIVPSGNELIIKMRIPENAGKVSLSCIRDHDAYSSSTTDPSTEIFDETLLKHLTIEDGYYIFKCKMPYSQCTFKLHVDAVDENGNFIIEDYEDLCNMVTLVNSGDEKYTKGNYILTNDIDCPQESKWKTSIGQTALYYNADPEADGNWGFEGTFDGNGHTIKNLTVVGSTKEAVSTGLFGTVSGTVKNLTIENFIYQGAGEDTRVGAIAGQVLNGGKIVNCCLINGNINAKVINTIGVAGGIAGANYSGTIENCYVYNLTITASRSGGIVGDNYGDGNNADGTDRLGTIKNCYTTTKTICERGTATDSISDVSAERYATGEIAYLLNKGTIDGTQAWYQNLDNGLTPDTYPVLVSNYENTVYKVNLQNKTYSNYEDGMSFDELDKDENGNFIIKTYRDLSIMAKKVNGGNNEYINGNYVLANDIDCSGQTWTTPIGTDETSFDGKFDGQNYTISNLKINGDTFCGLFGYSNGTIVNLNLNECHVNGSNFVGGICGCSYGTIKNCSFNGTVSGENSVGGICGYSAKGSILKSYNLGSISGERAVGGISGVLDNSTINNCYNAGIISSTQRVGGIVGSGMREFHITNCYNVGEISGSEMYGPICGNREVFVTINPTIGTILNCFYLGDSETDAFAGSSFKTAEQFKSGEVAYRLNNGVTDGTQVWYQNVDYKEPYDKYPHFNKTDSNTVYKVDKEDKTYSNNKDYVPCPIDTDENGNFIIKTYDDLCTMAVMVNSGENEYVEGSYVLANDIDCQGHAWTTPIGTGTIQFNGKFDGQGYTISNLNVNSNVEDGSRQGLFAVLGEDSVVKNLNVDNASVFPAENGAGAIAKQNTGTIKNCMVKNSSIQLGNLNYLGGIAGLNNGTIENCAVVNSHLTRRLGGTSSLTMGGITETNNGTVKNCYTYSCTFNNGTSENSPLVARGNAPENSYYFTNSNVNKTNGVEVDTVQFASGEVASLLNKGVTDATQAWYQNLDNGEIPDLYPTLTNNNKNTVYTIPSQKGYSNYQHKDKASVLERVDLRTYQRVINPDGTFSEDSTYYYGYGLVNNETKEVTLFVLNTAHRIGILRHQGRDEKHTAGEMSLLGGYPELDETSKELLESGKQEPDIYTDKNGCIFIKIPENGKIPPLKVTYTEKPTSEYTSTEYTVKIKIVDSSHFKTIGATRTSTLSKDDPNYAVFEAEQAYANALKANPQKPTNSTKDPSKNTTTSNTTIKTGSPIYYVFALLIIFVSLAFILVYKRKRKTN